MAALDLDELLQQKAAPLLVSVDISSCQKQENAFTQNYCK